MSAKERTQQMHTIHARRVALLMVAALSMALTWASAAWAHSEPYCGHSGRTHDGGGVVHRTTFVGHEDGYHLTKAEHLKWSGTWRTKELCRHHLKPNAPLT